MLVPLLLHRQKLALRDVQKSLICVVSVARVRTVLDNYFLMSRFLSFLFLLFLLPTFVFAQADAPTVGTVRGPSDAPTVGTVRGNEPSAGVASVSAGIDAAVGGTGLQNFCGTGTFQSCVERIVGGAINIVLSLVGIILLGYTLYAGFLWMTSGGEKDQAEEAMKMIRQAVIGLLIVIMSFVISSYILAALGNISQGRAAPPPGATPAAGAATAPRTP